MGEDYHWPTWDDLLMSEASIQGWQAPQTVFWKRWPVIRHLRCILRGNPRADEAYDYWLSNMIWRGHC